MRSGDWRCLQCDPSLVLIVSPWTCGICMAHGSSSMGKGTGWRATWPKCFHPHSQGHGRLRLQRNRFYRDPHLHKSPPTPSSSLFAHPPQHSCTHTLWPPNLPPSLNSRPISASRTRTQQFSAQPSFFCVLRLASFHIDILYPSNPIPLCRPGINLVAK